MWHIPLHSVAGLAEKGAPSDPTHSLGKVGEREEHKRDCREGEEGKKSGKKGRLGRRTYILELGNVCCQNCV